MRWHEIRGEEPKRRHQQLSYLSELCYAQHKFTEYGMLGANKIGRITVCFTEYGVDGGDLAVEVWCLCLSFTT